MGLVLGSSFAVTDDLLDVESGNAGHLETRGGRTWFNSGGGDLFREVASFGDSGVLAE